jgi:hypothetical protein
VAEAVFQRLILGRLHHMKPAVWHQRVNVVVARAGPRTIRSVDDGFPDIILCVAGRFVAIEVKDEGEHQRPAQRAWQADFEAAGGIYLLAVGRDGALRAIQQVAALAGQQR